MLTKEQKKDAERLARYIAREGLVSMMNDTKWQRLFHALEPIQGWLSFRRKDVRENEGAPTSWCGDFHYMFAGWSNIEWLDIGARRRIRLGTLVEARIEDNTALLIQAVRQAGVPFSRHDECIRVWGYVRPGVSPQWEQ